MSNKGIVNCINCYSQNLEGMKFCQICKEYGQNATMLTVFMHGFAKILLPWMANFVPGSEPFRTRDYGPLCQQCAIRHIIADHQSDTLGPDFTKGLMKGLK